MKHKVQKVLNLINLHNFNKLFNESVFSLNLI